MPKVKVPKADVSIDNYIFDEDASIVMLEVTIAGAITDAVLVVA